MLFMYCNVIYVQRLVHLTVATNIAMESFSMLRLDPNRASTERLMRHMKIQVAITT